LEEREKAEDRVRANKQNEKHKHSRAAMCVRACVCVRVSSREGITFEAVFGCCRHGVAVVVVAVGVAAADDIRPCGGGGGGTTGRTDGRPEVTNGRSRCRRRGFGGTWPPTSRLPMFNKLPPTTPRPERTARSPRRRWLPVQISRYLLYRARSWGFHIYIYIRV